MSAENNRRHEERVKLEMDALVVPDRCVEPDRVTLRDLSRDGAFITSPIPLTLGQRLRLVLKLGRDRTNVTLPARVVRSPGGGAGLRFGEVDVVSRAALEQVLREHAERWTPVPVAQHVTPDPGTPELEETSSGLRGLLRRILGK